jgi:hypothetical protein
MYKWKYKGIRLPSKKSNSYTQRIFLPTSQFPDFLTQPLGGFINNILRGLLLTSGFWPRVRARALHPPVFWGLLPRKTGRCAPPPHAHRSFAASYSIPKNRYKKKYQTRSAHVMGFSEIKCFPSGWSL